MDLQAKHKLNVTGLRAPLHLPRLPQHSKKSIEIRLQYLIYSGTYQKTHSPFQTTPVPTPKSKPTEISSQSPHKSKKFHSPSTDTSSEIRKKIKIHCQLEDVFRVSHEHAAKSLSQSRKAKEPRCLLNIRQINGKWKIRKTTQRQRGYLRWCNQERVRGRYGG